MIELHHLNALWLLPPLLAALMLLRLYRGRRREILAGSLLIWRRLAQQQPKTPPRRFIADLSLLLQCGAVTALICALSGPALGFGKQNGRTLLCVLDNGPRARARDSKQAPLWNSVIDEARIAVAKLHAGDRVFLARSSPAPRLLNKEGISPSKALSLLGGVGMPGAALSGPDRNTLILFAHDMARNAGNAARVDAMILTPQNAQQNLDNVAIVDFGSVPVANGFQVLVRLRNFSEQSAEGSVSAGNRKKPCKLEAGGEQAIVFDLPNDAPEKLYIRWQRDDGKPDALPEDDFVFAVRNTASSAALHVRFEQPAPGVERLFRSALKAEILSAGEGAADLAVFVNAVPPEFPANARAILLLAPENGFQNIFDIGDKPLGAARAQRQEDDPLTRGIADRPEGLFEVARVREIRRTGDFKTVLQDSISQHPLAGRFIAAGNHPGYFFAFVPGEGAGERLLSPELAAILVRIALESARSVEPYRITSAAAIESAAGEPMPGDVKAEDYPNGVGVLNESVSNLRSMHASSESFSENGEGSADTFSGSIDLSPWLVVLGLALAAFELSRECRRVARS